MSLQCVLLSKITSTSLVSLPSCYKSITSHTVKMKFHPRNLKCKEGFVIDCLIRPFVYHPVYVHEFEEVVQILVQAHAIIEIAGDLGQHPEGQQTGRIC